MSSSLMLSCSCGSMSWSLASAAPRRHVVCYCADCRSFPTALGHPEFLDENGGLHILQTVPGHVTITHGHQHLAALKLSPKGMVRYHSGCCGTPIANVLEKKTLPFVGLAIPAPAEQCGPVRSRVNVDSTRGKVKELNPAAAFFTVFGRAIGAVFKGKTNGPFHGEDGLPVVTPRVLTLAERNAARTPLD